MLETESRSIYNRCRIANRGVQYLLVVARVLHSHHLDPSSYSCGLVHLIDLHRELMHREVEVWSLLLGVPSGHRVDLELSQ